MLTENEGKGLWMHSVQCVPQASTNLMSVSAAIRDDASFAPQDNAAYSHVTSPNGWEYRIAEQFGLYVLKRMYPTSLPVVCQACLGGSSAGRATAAEKHSCNLRKLRHERLGHPGKTASEHLETSCALVFLYLLFHAACEQHCDPCVRGKQARPPFPAASNKATHVLHLINADTVGELPTIGAAGKRYFLTIVDEVSG